jgi:hypothetical protein
MSVSELLEYRRKTMDYSIYMYCGKNSEVLSKYHLYWYLESGFRYTTIQYHSVSDKTVSGTERSVPKSVGILLIRNKELLPITYSKIRVAAQGFSVVDLVIFPSRILLHVFLNSSIKRN